MNLPYMSYKYLFKKYIFDLWLIICLILCYSVKYIYSTGVFHKKKYLYLFYITLMVLIGYTIYG